MGGMTATEDRLDALLRAGVLTPVAHRRAVALALAPPDAAAWRRFVARAGLALGAACCLAAIVFFIAWNWDGLPRLAQFGSLELLMVGAAFLSARAPDTFARQMALTFAAVMLGPLLAAYGQAYQTGADPYELFLTWALLAAPLAFVARFTPLWMVMAVLFNLSLSLFLDQVRPFGGGEFEFSPPLLAALNGAMWLVYELWRGKKSRWPARVLACWAGMVVLPLAALYAAGDRWFHGVDGAWSLVACLLLSVLAAVIYRGKRLDLFMLSLAAFCVSFIAAAFVWRLLGQQDTAPVHLVMGVLFVAEAAVSVGWIRHCRREVTA
jgi:uncharacterized membrane protein